MHFFGKALGIASLSVILSLSCLGVAFSQPGQCCRGPAGHRGPGPGMSGSDHRADMELFHYLLDHRDQIRRSVTEVEGGVETLTESEEPQIAAKIRQHVRSMYARLDERRPIHQRDPLFAEIFQHADDVTLTMTDTEKGLLVRETSDDPYVTKLIRAHAEVVSQFLANGRSEMMKDHPLPQR